jgi:hypothetical protein
MNESKITKETIVKIIREETEKIMKEASYKNGGLLDPKQFDPFNPEVHVSGFGSMDRNTLRKGIYSRLTGVANTAKEAAKGGPMSYNRYKSLVGMLEETNVIMTMIKAEIEIAEQIEAIRKKGGRRDVQIPKQM